MIEGKVSMHTGKRVSRLHNNRQYLKDGKDWNKDGHIDLERTKLNRIIEDNSIEDFFKKEFRDSLFEFNLANEKKHPDRLIGFNRSEYDRLTEKHGIEKATEMMKDKAAHAYYLEQKKNVQECIFQMSDGENFQKLVSEQGFEKAIQMHGDFMQNVVDDWQKNNPNLKIIGAYMHFDETTPHLHLDFVPVADSDKGLKHKVSLEGALKESGFKREKGQKYDNTPYKQWLSAERSRAEQIASEYIKVIPAEHTGTKHQEPWQYRQQAIENKLKAAEEKLQKLDNIPPLPPAPIAPERPKVERIEMSKSQYIKNAVEYVYPKAEYKHPNKMIRNNIKNIRDRAAAEYEQSNAVWSAYNKADVVYQKERAAYEQEIEKRRSEYGIIELYQQETAEIQRVKADTERVRSQAVSTLDEAKKQIQSVSARENAVSAREQRISKREQELDTLDKLSKQRSLNTDELSFSVQTSVQLNRDMAAKATAERTKYVDKN